MDNYQVPKKIVVHTPTPFHSDDVMCVAMAKRLNPDVVVEFNNNPSPEDIADEGKTGIYVADVGRGRFDHHQPDARVREDGNKYAACGLLHEVWKDKLFPNNQEAQIYYEDVYIKPIEHTDNGLGINALSSAISSYVPGWDSEESYEEAFYKAVDFLEHITRSVQERSNEITDGKAEASEVLKNEHAEWILTKELREDVIYDTKEYHLFNPLEAIMETEYPLTDPDESNYTLLHHAIYYDYLEDETHTKDDITYDLSANYINNCKSVIRGFKHVREAYKNAADKSIVVLDRYYDEWQAVLASSKAKYVIYPSKRGGYNLQCVPPLSNLMDQKVPLTIKDKKQEYDGLIFTCGSFLAGFNTVDQAVKAAEKELAVVKEKGFVKYWEENHKEDLRKEEKAIKDSEVYVDLKKIQEDIIKMYEDGFSEKCVEKILLDTNKSTTEKYLITQIYELGKTEKIDPNNWDKTSASIIQKDFDTQEKVFKHPEAIAALFAVCKYYSCPKDVRWTIFYNFCKDPTNHANEFILNIAIDKYADLLSNSTIETNSTCETTAERAIPSDSDKFRKLELTQYNSWKPVQKQDSDGNYFLDKEIYESQIKCYISHEPRNPSVEYPKHSEYTGYDIDLGHIPTNEQTNQIFDFIKTAIDNGECGPAYVDHCCRDVSGGVNHFYIASRYAFSPEAAHIAETKLGFRFKEDTDHIHDQKKNIIRRGEAIKYVEKIPKQIREENLQKLKQIADGKAEKEKTPIDKLVAEAKELSKTKEVKEVTKSTVAKDKRKSLIDD